MDRMPEDDMAERPRYEMKAFGVLGDTNEDGTVTGILEMYTAEGVIEFTIGSPENAALMMIGLQTYIDVANSRTNGTGQPDYQKSMI